MDFTRIKCISESCKDRDIKMTGAGGSFGGRVNYSCVKCPECGLKLIIMPVSGDYSYSISAMTPEEMKSRREKARRLNELDAEADILRRELRD